MIFIGAHNLVGVDTGNGVIVSVDIVRVVGVVGPVRAGGGSIEVVGIVNIT